MFFTFTCPDITLQFTMHWPDELYNNEIYIRLVFSERE